MANNCLQTKLKVSIQNNNLSKLGIITMTINVTDTSATYLFHAVENNKSILTIVSGPANGKIKKSGTDNAVTSFPLDYSLDSYVFTVAGTYIIEISEKYNVNYLDVVNCSVNIEELEYSPTTFIRFSETGVRGNIENLNMTGLTTLRLSNTPNVIGNLNNCEFPVMTTMLITNSGIDCNVSVFENNTIIQTVVLTANAVHGDIASFTGCTNLSNLQVNSTDIEGNINSLLDNGTLKNTHLTTLSISNTPNLVKSAEDIATLRSLGVSVTV